MTITILPLYFTTFFLIYFGAVLIIWIIALVKTIKLYRLKKLRSIDFLIGFLISLALYGLLHLLYEGEKGGLSQLMLSSVIMVFLPSLVVVATHKSNAKNYTSKVFLISIVFTMIGIIVNPLILNLLKNM